MAVMQEKCNNVSIVCNYSSFKIFKKSEAEDMEKSLTAQSFVVRVYRVDTEDRRKITGMVETLDGSGRKEPFRNADELMGLLNSGANDSRKGVRKAKRED